MTRRVVVGHMQRLGELALDGIGGFQPRYKILCFDCLAAYAVELFVKRSRVDLTTRAVTAFGHEQFIAIRKV